MNRKNGNSKSIAILALLAAAYRVYDREDLKVKEKILARKILESCEALEAEVK